MQRHFYQVQGYFKIMTGRLFENYSICMSNLLSKDIIYAVIYVVYGFEVLLWEISQGYESQMIYE